MTMYVIIGAFDNSVPVVRRLLRLCRTVSGDHFGLTFQNNSNLVIFHGSLIFHSAWLPYAFRVTQNFLYLLSSTVLSLVPPANQALCSLICVLMQTFILRPRPRRPWPIVRMLSMFCGSHNNGPMRSQLECTRISTGVCFSIDGSV